MSTSELRRRHESEGYEHLATSSRTERSSSSQQGASYWSRFSQWIQDSCYQIMAYTVWDNVVSGFKPGRVRAIELLDIQSRDTVLLVGEGSGLDFECLPEQTNRAALKAFDFSPQMVRQCKIKAQQLDIPEDNCFVGDAQNLPFTDERFDKIYFPLSIASIPNPSLALEEAERVLSQGGKIVVFDKLVDDAVSITWRRKILNIFTRCIFADINRNLSIIQGILMKKI